MSVDMKVVREKKMTAEQHQKPRLANAERSAMMALSATVLRRCRWTATTMKMEELVSPISAEPILATAW
jgi:hypothetical protein